MLTQNAGMIQSYKSQITTRLFSLLLQLPNKERMQRNKADLRTRPISFWKIILFIAPW